MKKLVYLAYCAIILFPSIAFSQDNLKKKYTATEIAKAPTIDAKLDDEAWNSGEWINDFTQFEPYNDAAATQRTEFKVLFDKDNLYVAIKAFDTSPDSIVQRLTRRDNPDGDFVGIAFDSYHDLRTAFMFAVSAGGVKFDQMLTEDGNNEDQSWDPNWWVKVDLTDEGWLAEMKIPFSQLRFEKESDGVWGLEVFRQTYRHNELDFWQHISKDAPGMVHLFGEMDGLKEIKPRKIFDITPYGIAKLETYEAETGNPFADGKDYDINGGIDAKIGVTNNLTLDLTINPDFGQVEADPSEVNLTAYESYFQEKRPFFIEGANITTFGIGIGDGGVGNDNLFYSRRIGRRPRLYPDLNSNEYARVPVNTPIIGAVKLTGKTSNGLSIGVMESVTAEGRAEIDDNGTSRYETVEPLTNYFLARVQKDYNDGNTIIGGMITSTNRWTDTSTEDYFHKDAYTGGVDFTQYFKKKVWMFNVNAAFSQVNGTADAITRTQESSARYFQREDNDYVNYDPTKTSLMGSGGRLQLIRQKGHWTHLAVVLWKTPGFELNDMGYLRQADQLFTMFWGQYRVWEPKGIYRSWNLSGDYYNVWDFGGSLLGHGLEFNGNMNFKNFWNFWGHYNLNTNGISNTSLRGGPRMRTEGSNSIQYNVSTDSRKKLHFYVYNNFGRGFDGSSKTFSVGSGFTYKPINTLTVSFNPRFNKSFNELQYIGRESFGGDDRYLFASIDQKVLSASIRISYNVTPDLTLQYWGQPFIASGKYSAFKTISNPMADSYRDRFDVLTNNQISPLVDGEYNIDENTDGNIDYS
ncbi:MAG: carbohydrate binding family 9 domain-containing protein, partial [Bacteroidales bacterium]|nr:carbohydrate binding family 9 domain-containing protein [Bacteroidales bacterium]